MFHKALALRGHTLFAQLKIVCETQHEKLLSLSFLAVALGILPSVDQCLLVIISTSASKRGQPSQNLDTLIFQEVTLTTFI